MERQTRQKQAVMQAIAASGRSLNAAEIRALAAGRVPSINLSTVYRQLETLQDDPQVVHIDLPGQAPRFEAPCHAPQARGHVHHHHHFHCTHCDRVFPIHACPGGMQALAAGGWPTPGSASRPHCCRWCLCGCRHPGGLPRQRH